MAADLDDCSEFWNRVEDVTREIIELVHPTLVSEDQRRNVFDYMQRLIKKTLGCEVHSFGSVPLKTYLPDGDIDLTTFGGPWTDDELAHKVFSVLEREKNNVDAGFIIKDVQLIRAEVMLVTCLVQNFVVDISFNKLGGICTLCFLEKIDHHIGKDHLFKRSIILIKVWCYYESHILGAVHGLISTYALETLVLYIFHLFHSSLDGPLAVLYKFLDYFSKFDWDKYCISLSGPVCRSSLPEIVVETPENGGQDLLLTSEFLEECLEMYSVPSRGFETHSLAFTSKYLNIIDPLKKNNNLGRSVNKANFNRIRTAFTFGARKLRQIILQSEGEDIGFELRKFFSNLLRKHRSGPDVLGGDAKEFATMRIQRLEISEDAMKSMCVSPLNGKHHSLHRIIENGEVLSGNKVEKLQENSSFADFGRVKEDMHAASTPNFLSDLTGDCVSQLYSLVYGRWCLNFSQNGPVSPLPIKNNSWEASPNAPPFIPNAQVLLNANGAHVFHMNLPNANFGINELTKNRGIGTYFPNLNQYRDRPFHRRRRRSRRNKGITRERHCPNQTNGGGDMSQAGIHGSFSGTNGSDINHPCEPLPAEVRYPPEGSKKSDSPTSTPSSIQEDRQSYNLTDDQEFPPL